MYHLKVISSTVRPGRKGPAVAQWITDLANSTGQFNAGLLDLGEINLPLMNEPKHPMMRQYEHDYTKKWSTEIDAADALIFVTAEYDYSYPASLKNALEYLVHEWSYKAAGIVSYSMGPFAGVRAMNNLKADLLPFKMMPLAESVTIPSLGQLLDEESGAFRPNEIITQSADLMLKQLVRWTKGMRAIKADV